MRPVIRSLAVGLVTASAIAAVWIAIPDRTVIRELQLRTDAAAQSIGEDIGAPAITLQLVSLNWPPREADEGNLTVALDGDAASVPIEMGSQVSLGEAQYSVRAIRAWAGLLHRPPGAPMINVAVQPPDGDWIENVFVQRGAWRVVTLDIAVFATPPDAAYPVQGAQWGVVEGDRIHWFTSFVPGTGIELDDGTVVTLLARRPSARILVEFDQNGEKTRTWFNANTHDETSPIQYEDPGVASLRVLVAPDDRGNATITLIEDDLEHWSRPVSLGEVATDDDLGLNVRIDQIESDAYPLLATESPYLEAVLANDTRVLRIREGEAVRVGESTVTFEAVAKPRQVTAEVKIDGAGYTFVEGTAFHRDSWRIDGFQALNPAEASLTAAYFRSHLRFRVIGAAICLFAASIVLLAARRRT